MAPPPIGRIARSCALCVVAAAFLAGCTSGDDEPEQAESTPTTVTATSTTTLADRPAEPCSAATLGAAAEGRYPGVTILDEVCNPQTAIATMEGTAVPAGSAVGLYFAGPDGRWLLAMTFADLTALESGAPPQQVSRALIQSWDRKREQRTNPRAPVVGGGSTTTDTTQPPATAPGGE